MKFYIDYVPDEGKGKTGKINLYYPNSKDECTEEFMRFFAQMPFDPLTDDEREKLNTKAMYKTTYENFLRMREIFQQLQVAMDKFDERNMLEMLTLKGLPIFVSPSVAI